MEFTLPVEITHHAVQQFKNRIADLPDATIIEMITISLDRMHPTHILKNKSQPGVIRHHCHVDDYHFMVVLKKDLVDKHTVVLSILFDQNNKNWTKKKYNRSN